MKKLNKSNILPNWAKPTNNFKNLGKVFGYEERNSMTSFAVGETVIMSKSKLPAKITSMGNGMNMITCKDFFGRCYECYAHELIKLKTKRKN